MGRSDSLPLISPHFVAFVWRYLRFVPCSSPPARDGKLGISLELVAGTPAGNHDGNGRVSQVPERPSCPYALFLDPGRTDARQAIAASRRGPRLIRQRWLPRTDYFEAQSHGIRTHCLRFAVKVSFPHARLASGRWPSSAGRDSLTRRVAVKGFQVRASFSFLELS